MVHPFQHAIVDVHGNYRAKKITYERPDELVSDVVTPRTLRPHIVRAALFFGILLFLFWLALFAAMIDILVAVDEDSRGRDPEPSFGLFWFVMIIMALVGTVWLVSLIIPVREPIAEYGLLIEGQAAVLPMSYAWITHTLRSRRSPFPVESGTARGVPVLVFSHDRERAMIVVQSCGVDLYVGWSMWRARSSLVLIGHLLRDAFQLATVSVAGEVRTAETRAFREVVHSLTREGIQAAITEPPLLAADAFAEVASLTELTEPRLLIPTDPAANQEAPQPRSYHPEEPLGRPQSPSSPLSDPDEPLRRPQSPSSPLSDPDEPLRRRQPPSSASSSPDEPLRRRQPPSSPLSSPDEPLRRPQSPSSPLSDPDEPLRRPQPPSSASSDPDEPLRRPQPPSSASSDPDEPLRRPQPPPPPSANPEDPPSRP